MFRNTKYGIGYIPNRHKPILHLKSNDSVHIARLNIHTDTKVNKLYLGYVVFHFVSEEEMVRQAVSKDYLRVEPAIGKACAAGIEHVVAIEDSFVLCSPRR